MSDMSIQEIEELAERLECRQFPDPIYDESVPTKYRLAYAPDKDCQAGASALRQLLDAQKWREIETAPKDGSEIWILYPYPILEQKARWVREGPIKDMWVGSRPTWDHDEASGKLVLLPEDEWDHQTFPSSEPTHWMPIVPLPLPPLKEQGEQGDG